jgi:L-iditol 2-dehydrogenase
MRGALRVLCIGAPELRLANAARLGAAAVLNFETHTERQRHEWVLEQTSGRGADITIEAAGAPAAVAQAMRYTRDAGRVVVVGQYTDHGEISFNPHLDLNRKHLEVRGCWGSDFSHFYRGAQIMADARMSHPWSLMKLERYSLIGANRALADVSSGRVVKALISPQEI